MILEVSFPVLTGCNLTKFNKNLIPALFHPKKKSDMVTSLKFRDIKDSFQRELNEDIRKIKSLFVLLTNKQNLRNVKRPSPETFT